ncbi:MAG: DEAD/DEAH box helicase [Acetanaerobacterium sp.]
MRFQDLELSEEIQRGIKAMGFEETTPIQTVAIPAIMEGRDIIGQAQTGTGKTCAFAIPAIEMLEENTGRVQVLVLCPTRELAIQTAEEFSNVSKFVEGVRILPIYGGQPIDRQIFALKKRPQIVIGTPGRIMDHMRRNTLKLEDLRMVILDEADEMLSMGFQEDLDVILQKTPAEKQTVLFSATMPRAILAITNKYQKNPEHLQALHKELTATNTEQYYIEVRESSKLDVLSRMIDGNNLQLCLVFCNTKKRVDELSSSLQTRGYMAEALHGDIRQNERSAVMARFKSGDINVLVATDVAARGIDVDNIEAVFNYDLPNDEEYYVHRIGRTGRAGKSGKAYTFISGREFGKLKEIQRFTKAKIKPATAPTVFDIEENRIGSLLKKVVQSIGEGDNSRYVRYVEQIIEESSAAVSEEQPDPTTMDIAATLLKLLFQQETSVHKIKLPAKQNIEPRPYKPYRRR